MDTDGVPLSPADVGPVGFEMQNMQAGVSPSPNPPPGGIYPDMSDNNLPPPPAPIGFEGQEPNAGPMPPPPSNEEMAPPHQEAPPSRRSVGFVNQGYHDDNGHVGGLETDEREKVAILSMKPLEDGDGNPSQPIQPADVVSVTVQDEESGGPFDDDIILIERGAAPQTSAEEAAQSEASMFFSDGKRRIDFVLVHEADTDPDDEARKSRNRFHFEENLRKQGLDLETSTKERDALQITGKYAKQEVHYTKVHAPWEFLTRYAEISNMKMPLAKNDMIEKFETCWSKFPTPFDYDEAILPEIPDYFTAPFSRSRARQFIIDDEDTFFSPAQRSLLAYQVLSRAVFEDLGDRAKNKFGIKRLLNNGSYAAAFPLHDGEYSSEQSLLVQGPENMRHLLYETWARPGVWYKFQPLDHIRQYFGEKVGIYFAWLGYYTGLLVPAGLMGLAIFIYGCIRLPFNETSKDICDENGAGNFTMCPLCDGRCTYWKLERSCIYARVTYLFDNEATVAFAAFMALWSAVFHEMWKRKEAEIEYDWDVADYEEEETIRPEFEASVRRRKVNPINKVEEPYIGFCSRVLRLTSSLWVVLFMLCVVVAAVFGVIVYRTTVSALLYAVDQETVKERASTITSVTAACINLVIIVILSRVYLVVARVLTNFETHRTLTEWEDSFTLKMFLFQFVNHYASLFYIAFFKGKLTGRPGNYVREIKGARQEECDPAGCLIELCIQLAIIMVGKQAINNFTELILPLFMNWFKSRKVKEQEEKNKEKIARWEKDYTMSTMPDLGLFDEYLEMVIQYGFVTIFVAAFPLAPLFALLNNIIEIRLDAYKFITQWRRPLAIKAQDIGIWFGILRGVSAIAIVTNACIIAFTSEFIPKLVYRYAYSENDDLEDYIDFTLSYFNVSDFEPESVPNDPPEEGFPDNFTVTVCRYRAYREPPGTPDEYDFTIEHWHILAAKLAFVVVFILAVSLLSWFVAFLVPDMPQAVKLQMLREKYLAREAVMEAEHLRPNVGHNRDDDHVTHRKPSNNSRPDA